MKKYIIFVIVCFFQPSHSATLSTYIGGMIQNAGTMQLTIDNQSVSIEESGSFEYRFSLDKSTYIAFKIDEEIDLFLEPGDSLFITLDTKAFHTTFVVSGKGERINRFLVQNAINDQELDDYFNRHYREIFALGEDAYVSKMDSFKITFDNQLATFVRNNKIANDFFIRTQEAEILYFRADMLVRYPNWHRQFSGNPDFKPSGQFHGFLDLLDFNDPELFELDQYSLFLNHYVTIRAEEESQTNPSYENKEYKQIRAKFNTMVRTFTNPKIKDEMLYSLMKPFVDWNNIDGMQDLLLQFKQHCTTSEYLADIERMVEKDKTIRKQCEVQIYKTVDNIALRAHVYRPDRINPGDRRAAVAFFHGGGWQSGKPEWGHSQCQHFSSLGLVAISFEYRLIERYDVTPIECIADAKSAIRWMRIHSEELGIDPERIAVSGFSAGGHLALCTAMIDQFDEPDEDHSISSAANAFILWSAAGNLRNDRYFNRILKGRVDAKDCDPAAHIRPGLPPAIIFHGSEDDTVPVWKAKAFAHEMKEVGNRCEIHVYEGQTHLSWGKNSEDVMRLMDEFLISLGYLSK